MNLTQHDKFRNELNDLRCKILRKMIAQLDAGHGSDSNKINAETEVLPELNSLIAELDEIAWQETKDEIADSFFTPSLTNETYLDEIDWA